jgi:hypothetical protein
MRKSLLHLGAQMIPLNQREEGNLGFLAICSTESSKEPVVV